MLGDDKMSVKMLKVKCYSLPTLIDFVLDITSMLLCVMELLLIQIMSTNGAITRI